MLASKSELDKALDRRRWQQGKYEAKQEADAAKTDFQKAMEQRAQRVNHVRNGVSYQLFAKSSSGAPCRNKKIPDVQRDIYQSLATEFESRHIRYTFFIDITNARIAFKRVRTKGGWIGLA